MTTLKPSVHDDEHGSTLDYWDTYPVPAFVQGDGIGTIADADEILLSDDELSVLSDDVDAWQDDQDDSLVYFADGLGFDVPAWPHADYSAQPPF